MHLTLPPAACLSAGGAPLDCGPQVLVLTRKWRWRHAPAQAFIGNAMRSAFGWSLRRLACATGAPTCKGCALRASCAYGSVFDPVPPGHAPHPSMRDGIPAYVLRPPPVDASNSAAEAELGIVLLPPALPHLDLILTALDRAWSDNPAFIGGSTFAGPWQTQAVDLLAQLPQVSPAKGTGSAELVVQTLSPVRIESRGRILLHAGDMRCADLARAVQRRLWQWQTLTGHALLDEQPLRQAWDSVTVHFRHALTLDQQRYSKSQQRSHPIGGMLFECHIHGPTEAINLVLPALHACTYLNLGKRTSFGLGRIQLLVDSNGAAANLQLRR